jgi:TP901 family phage tail tape measure protein
MPKEYYAGTVLAKMGLDPSGFIAGSEKVKRKNKELEKAIEKQQKKVRALGVAFTVVGGAVLAGFTKASQGAREFNKEIANITTLTTPAITSTSELKESIRRLSVDAAKDTSDVAGGAYEVASAFGEAALQGKSLEINVKGATAGMSSVTEAIKLTSAVTKGFGDTSEKAQQKVMDLSFITVKLGQTTFPELAASIGKTVPLMAAMGGKQEELFAGFATLTGVTGTAAEVSTQFSGVLGALIKPSTAMIKAIRIAGQEHLGLADATGKDLVEQLGLVGAMKAIISTTDGSMTALGKLIRRKEALTAVLALTGGQADVFNEKLIAMTDSEGSAEEAFLKVTQGVNAQGFAMEQATQKMKIASDRLGEAVTPALAAFKTILADIAMGISEWMKENPVLTKAIVTLTAAIAGLMVAIGPLLIALPHLKAGFIALKGAMVGIPGILGKIATTAIGKLGLFAAATWTVTKAWNAIGDAIGPSVEKLSQFSMIQMGWTEHGKQALFFKDSLIELAKKIDPTVTGLRGAAQVINNNREAYESLHPRLKRIVDGMINLRIAAVETNKVISEESKKPVAQTVENVAAILEIQEAAELKIREMTLSQTQFKIEQLNEEYQRTRDILMENNATKIQMQSFERAHSLELQKIRDEAFRIKKEKADKQLIEEQKALDEAIKKQEEEIKAEEARQSAHQVFLADLLKQRQDIMLQNITERDGWRAGELARIDVWESEQLQLAQIRFENEKISFQMLQDEKTAINETASDKREQVENEARDRQEEQDKNYNNRMMSEFNRIVDQKQRKMGKYFDFLRNINSVYSAFRDKNLQSWYDEELRRINESGLSNEERTIAIENLDARMHAKKAALEAQAQKRERALAIAQAIANTAVAVTTALKALPWPLNLPAIAFAIFTGAAQITAIGGAFKSPGIESFKPGGETGGGTVDGGGGTEAGREIGGGGRGGERPGFQSGTSGFITPPNNFLVGEPYSPEIIQLRGDVQGVKMAVTPMGQTAAASQGGVNIHLDFSGMHVIDATDFENRVRDFLPKLMQKFFDSGTNRFPRRYLK